MKYLCTLALLAGTGHSATVPVGAPTFSVRASQIAPDEGLAMMKIREIASRNATSRCQASGLQTAVMINENPEGCDGFYSVHGFSKTCTFDFYCK